MSDCNKCTFCLIAAFHLIVALLLLFVNKIFPVDVKSQELEYPQWVGGSTLVIYAVCIFKSANEEGCLARVARCLMIVSRIISLLMSIIGIIKATGLLHQAPLNAMYAFNIVFTVANSCGFCLDNSP